MKHIRLTQRQQGFTMVELMISTTVFAAVLIIITSGIVHLSNDYYRGLNSSSTQNVAANVMNDISQTLQLSSESIGQATATSPSNFHMYCVGDKVYGYVPGVLLKDAKTATDNIGLYQVSQSGFASCDAPSANTFAANLNMSPIPATYTGSELLTANMRIAKLTIDDANPATGGCVTGAAPSVAVLCKINVTVLFGNGDDLFCDPNIAAPTTAGSCAPGSTRFAGGALETYLKANPTANIRCRSDVGSQYCAVSALTSVVQRRL